MKIFAHARLVTTGGLVAVGALLAAASAPAIASNDRNVAAAQPGRSSTAPATSQARTNANDQRQICRRMELSGSRLARRICMTRAEWEAEGGLPEGR